MAWTFDATAIDASGAKRNEKLDPPGFVLASKAANAARQDKGAHDADTEREIAKLKVKKAWDAALMPAKSIPMNAFMLYMSGNSIQIFSILITVMLLFNSVKAMFGVQSVFERFQTAPSGAIKSGLTAFMKDPLLLPMVVYLLMQGANLGLGVWKCGSMGLLPTATSDWLAFLDSKEMLEFSAGGWF